MTCCKEIKIGKNQAGILTKGEAFAHTFCLQADNGLEQKNATQGSPVVVSQSNCAKALLVFLDDCHSLFLASSLPESARNRPPIQIRRANLELVRRQIPSQTTKKPHLKEWWNIKESRDRILAIGEAFSRALSLQAENGFLEKERTQFKFACKFEAGSKTDPQPKQKADPNRSACFGWGSRIRTQTYRVRVCCATFTQIPNELLHKLLYIQKTRLSSRNFEIIILLLS